MYRRILIPCLLAGLFLLANTSLAQSGFEYAELTGVLQPDRLQVRQHGELRTVKLLGVHAPELGKTEGSSECFARQATKFVLRFLSDTSLVLEKDPSAPELTEEGALLRYVYVQPGLRDLNAAMISDGIGRVDQAFDFRRRKDFLVLEKRSRSLNSGLWGNCAAEGESPRSKLGERKLVDDAQELIDDLARRTEADRRNGVQRPPAQSRSQPVQPEPTRQRSSCCKICKKGKACGNGCISRSYTCRKPPGCACNG